jgi:signal transduction histidine kinase
VRWFRSLRSRLTALFVGIAALAVTGAAVGMSELVDAAVWGTVDAELGEEAETVCSLLESGAVNDLRRAVAAIAREPRPGPGKFIQVARSDGRVLARTGGVPKAIVNAPTAWSLPATVRAPGRRRPYRVVWRSSGTGCHAVVGARVNQQVRTLRNARIAIAGSAAGLLVVLGLLAWVITGRATVELGRLAAEIETIEAGSLSRPLIPRRTLEVDRLAAVLNRLLERLDAAMGHLRRFTADAAHELRTPIAGLRARLEATLAGPASEGGYRDGLLDGLEQTERLGSLAEHLLMLSAVEAGVDGGAPQSVRLDALAREVTEALEPVAQEQGRRFECATPTPVTVRGKPLLLKRVLLNLVDNAFRHTPPTSAVRLAVRANGDDAVVTLSDEGPGIPATDLPHVFDRFHRGTGGGAGIGLGLALCREIVLQHRGTIGVESDPDGGTTITVRLPA